MMNKCPKKKKKIKKINRLSKFVHGVHTEKYVLKLVNKNVESINYRHYMFYQIKIVKF